jgi:hypothetical protein
MFLYFQSRRLAEADAALVALGCLFPGSEVMDNPFYLGDGRTFSNDGGICDDANEEQEAESTLSATSNKEPATTRTMPPSTPSLSHTASTTTRTAVGVTKSTTIRFLPRQLAKKKGPAK